MLSPSSSPAGGAKYRKSCQQWRLFFGPMISSLSVNHWRKQCFRLVRAQQAEPNIRKLQRWRLFFDPMISYATLIGLRLNGRQCQTHQQAAYQRQASFPSELHSYSILLYFIFTLLYALILINFAMGSTLTIIACCKSVFIVIGLIVLTSNMSYVT